MGKRAIPIFDGGIPSQEKLLKGSRVFFDANRASGESQSWSKGPCVVFVT